MARARTPITPRVLIELPTPHSPCVSPDGKRVIFVVEEADFEESRVCSSLWMADVPAGRPRRITFSYEGEHSPLWSPDGAWIAFLSTRPDMTEPPPPDEHLEEEMAHRDQVWLLPVAGGEAQRLTNVREGVRAVRWMPDGKSLLFLAPEARPQPIQHVRDDGRKRKVDAVVEHADRLRMQLWEVDTAERKPELVHVGDRGLAEFDVAPDGRHVVLSGNGTGDPNDYHQFDLHVLDLDTGETRRLAERAGGKFHPQWSPDGSQVAFIANRDPAVSFSQACLFTVDAAGGVPRNLFEGVPYDVNEYVWGAGGALYAAASDRTAEPVMRVTADGVAPVPATAGADCLGLHARPLRRGGDALAAVLEFADRPAEVFALRGDRLKALTECGKAFRQKHAVPRQEVVRWTTDIGEVEGIVTYPVGRKPGPHPLIVMVHGGPKGHSTLALRSYLLHAAWAAEGYMVLRPNYRGSEGYGSDFAVASRRDLGGGDYRDIMAGVDHLVAAGLADPDRLGIMGGSYGGYMTNWAISQSDRFRAAVSMFGIFHLTTDFSNSELPRWDHDYLGAYYWDDPEIYRACSPGAHVTNIHTPVLILHGEADPNTFIANSREMYQALRLRGGVVEFVRYPREGHGLREPNHRLDEMRRCMAWFDRYLQPGGSARAARVGDRVEHDGYELVLTRAEDGDYCGRTDDDPRLVEIALSLASVDAVEAAWQVSLDSLRVIGPDGSAAPLAGVPVEAGGGRWLVQGDALHLQVAPDRDTGRMALALAVAFGVADAGGAYQVRLEDFPPISFTLGPRAERSPDREPEPR